MLDCGLKTVAQHRPFPFYCFVSASGAMATSLRCSEHLLDSKEDNAPDRALLFQISAPSNEQSGLLSPYRPGASYLPNPAYALSVQNSNSFCKYREQAYMWMLGVRFVGASDNEVCRSKGSDANIAYMGMNYFDRYLSYKKIEKANVELLLWMCIYLASSVYDCRTKYLSFVGSSSIRSPLERSLLRNLQFLLLGRRALALSGPYRCPRLPPLPLLSVLPGWFYSRGSRVQLSLSQFAITIERCLHE